MRRESNKNCEGGGKKRTRRENNKIVEEGIKTLRRENSKIVEEEEKGNIKHCAKKDGLPSLTILIESLI